MGSSPSMLALARMPVETSIARYWGSGRCQECQAQERVVFWADRGDHANACGAVSEVGDDFRRSGS
jgi:hypothetical protein